MKSQSVILTKLTEYPSDALLDQKALGEALGVCERTIRNMVIRNEIPPGMKLGGRKVWLAGKVRAYLSERAEAAAKKTARQMPSLGPLTNVARRRVRSR